MIKVIQIKDDAKWDSYVAKHATSNAYHAFHWQKIIERAYGYKTYALVAVSHEPASIAEQPEQNVKGILPLVHLKSPFLENRLVSMPYFDHGGILADNLECEKKLIQQAYALGKRLKAHRIELRHLAKIASFENGCSTSDQNNKVFSEEDIYLNPSFLKWSLRSHKVRLLLSLPTSSEALFKSFRSKLRSQINRPIKAGLTVKIGSMELLNDFYTVFSINMRDLGSPVHAKLLMQCVLEKFDDAARIVMVYKGDEPVAASLMLGFKDVMINPWASSLRQHSKESPNMLLYWSMLSYAADQGYRHFDFGRSTPGEGTYRFKTQWGAQPHPMYWYSIWIDQTIKSNEIHSALSEGKKKAIAAKMWQKLPVPVSRLVGPLIRKHIDL